MATQPASQTVALGGSVSLTMAATGTPAPTLSWQRNGSTVAGATAATLTLPNVQPADTGIYTGIALGGTAGTAAAISTPVIVGISTEQQVVGAGEQVGDHVPHPNGNFYDQVLLTGVAEAIKADPDNGEITRTSFIDADGDIVQVEFGGPGTLSLVLANAGDRAAPEKYNQSNVLYMKGHAGIVITGANENTNVTVFTVGRATAYDRTGQYNILKSPNTTDNNPANNGSPLFVGHENTVYDGIADLAFIAISSTNGRFGGIRAANANFYAAQGFTGIYAPGVEFTGPVFFGDIMAYDKAKPVLLLGSASDVRVTGGNMEQINAQPVQVSGVTQLQFKPGSDSHGNTLPAQTNRGTYRQDGVDVTTQIVVNPSN
ncbi:immunoglobulin domain-containing protein [Opitutus terrae]|uniref:immunoglobulin domain-containing protein n=1 Tax=Opitutus terrae TaxID=107709 RepID=UPI003CCD30A2